MRRAALLALMLVLSGCGRGVTLMAADGTMGTGRATGFGGGGDVEVELEGKVYRGRWINQQGGSVGFGAVGNRPVNFTSVDSAGGGNALMRADDGSTLRCRFTWSAFSQAGTGMCLDRAGKEYEMQVR